jgi:hypothetical protein
MSAIAENILPEVRSGVFVNIGAHDGVAFSNTLYLEKQLGWNVAVNNYWTLDKS